jgi:hypothetical protein
MRLACGGLLMGETMVRVITAPTLESIAYVAL